MHILPPVCSIVIAMIGFLWLRPFCLRSEIFAQLQNVLRPLDDQWTWITREGDVFEDVELQAVRAGEVFFQHKFGSAHVKISRLTRDSRRKLTRNCGTNPFSLR